MTHDALRTAARPDREVDRRTVLGAACAVGCAALVAGCGGSDSAAAPSTGGTGSSGPGAPAPSAASSSAASSAAASGVALAKLADIPDGGALVVKAKDGSSVVMVRAGSRVTGLSAKCTHRGCTVAPAGSELHCPCHGSRFALDGSVLGGPAAAPLPAYPLTVNDGSVVPA